MTRRQIELVQRTFGIIEAIAEDAMVLFYERLFELDPSLRAMFRISKEEQGRKLAQVLAIVVKSLDRLEQILPAVRNLGAKHAVYGVTEQHYATVGAALLWTLEQGLGPAFTDEVKESWAAAYGMLAGAMQEAADGVTVAA